MNISLNNIIQPYLTAGYNKNNQNQLYPNLAPLKQDTVSFTGSRKFNGANMAEAPQSRTCRIVETNAEPARFYLETILNKYLEPYKQTEDKSSNKRYPILKCTTRVKSNTSIREKVATKYLEDTRKPLNPKTTSGVKYYANDIVGARLTLKDANHELTKGIVNALKKAVDDGVLNITSIENYIPDEEKLPEGKRISDYEYSSIKELESLADAANAELITTKSKSGYCAIHLNVALDNPIFNKYNRAYAGYNGEIQIIGENVEKLKDTEDLCYKIKDNKITNSAYEPFKTYFLRYYNDDTKKAFNDYTYALYLWQRDLPKNSSGVFPSIKQLGFEGKVPPGLDFNILKKLKRSCDMQLEVKENEEKLNSKRLSTREETQSSILKNGEIDTLKKYISYTYK